MHKASVYVCVCVGVCLCVHAAVFLTLFHTERKVSTVSKSRPNKKTKKPPPKTSTKTQKAVQAVEVPVTSEAAPLEEEFEVESICAHQWVSPCPYTDSYTCTPCILQMTKINV